MNNAVTESVIERAALGWLENLGWAVKHGPEIAPDELGAERTDYRQVVLEQRLRLLLRRLVSAELRVQDAARFIEEIRP